MFMTLLLQFLMIYHVEADVFVNSFLYVWKCTVQFVQIRLPMMPCTWMRPHTTVHVDVWPVMFMISSQFKLYFAGQFTTVWEGGGISQGGSTDSFLFAWQVSSVVAAVMFLEMWFPTELSLRALRSQPLHLSATYLHRAKQQPPLWRKSLLCRRCLEAVTSRLMAAESQTPPASNSLLEKVLGGFLRPSASIITEFNLSGLCLSQCPTHVTWDKVYWEETAELFIWRYTFSISSDILWIEMAIKNSWRRCQSNVRKPLTEWSFTYPRGLGGRMNYWLLNMNSDVNLNHSIGFNGLVAKLHTINLIIWCHRLKAAGDLQFNGRSDSSMSIVQSGLPFCFHKLMLMIWKHSLAEPQFVVVAFGHSKPKDF